MADHYLVLPEWPGTGFRGADLPGHCLDLRRASDVVLRRSARAGRHQARLPLRDHLRPSDGAAVGVSLRRCELVVPPRVPDDHLGRSLRPDLPVLSDNGDSHLPRLSAGDRGRSLGRQRFPRHPQDGAGAGLLSLALLRFRPCAPLREASAESLQHAQQAYLGAGEIAGAASVDLRKHACSGLDPRCSGGGPRGDPADG